MARRRRDRFVHTFELLPTPTQARELDIRLRLARDIYNACLREGQRRLWHARHDPAWLQSKLLPPGEARREGFTVVQERYGFTETALRLYVTPHAGRRKYQYGPMPYEGSREPLRQAHYYDHLDGRTCHELAKRAFRSLEASLYQRGHGRARTRRRDEDIAVDCPDILFQDGQMRWNAPHSKLRVPVRLTPQNPDEDHPETPEGHALAHKPVEYGKRVLRRKVRGKERWYLQLTYEGMPLWQEKHAIGTQVLGLDLGPSALAIVWDGGSAKVRFCPGLEHDSARIRRMERVLDRSRRATNPQCFNPDGTWKKGARFVPSARYLRAKSQLADLYRQYAARRKNLLGKLVHDLIAIGATIKTEDLTYSTWARHWGKSIGRSGVGMFVQLLRQKCAQAGGELVEFSTRETKFSQLCHGCGTYVKKPLSQRVHHCPCGIGPVDRDIYSAFLARWYIADDGPLEMAQCREAWARTFNFAQPISRTPEPSRNGPLGESPIVSADGRARSVDNPVSALTQCTRRPEGSGSEGKEAPQARSPQHQESLQREPHAPAPGDPRISELAPAQEDARAPPPGRSTRPPPRQRSALDSTQLSLWQGDSE